LGLIRGQFALQEESALLSGPRGFGSVGLSIRLAQAVSVASAVAGVAGYCGANDAPVVVQALAQPSPGVPTPDFHVPQGPGRLGVLEPPKHFLHWTDHLEIVLAPADVARRCQTAGAKAAPGTRIHGCSYTVAGRCLIIRVDDPGVARHELAHCNGWKHPGS
jgi:hypothetical protein